MKHLTLKKTFGSLAIIFLLISGIIGGKIFLATRNENIPQDNETVKQGEMLSLRPLTDQLTTPSPSPQPSPSPVPPQKIIPLQKHLFQTFNNCGPASLSMTLSYYGIDVSQAELGNDLRPFQNPQGNNDDKSVSLVELAQKAREYDLVAFRRPAGDIALLEQFIAHDIPVITRTWLSNNEDIGHYRVVRGYNQTTNTLIQDDSLQGKGIEFSYDAFNQLWEAFNYEFLVIVPAEKKELVETILGGSTDEQQAWQQARQHAQDQISKNTDAVYARFNLLVANYHLGNYQTSVDIYEEIKDKLPNRILWYQIEPLLAYYQTENYDQVMRISEQIFENGNRSFSELYYLRGLIFEKRGQTQEAEAAFARAEQYNSQDYWRNNLEAISP